MAKYDYDNGYIGAYERELESFLGHVNDMAELAESREREYRRDYGSSWYEQEDDWMVMVA